MAFKYRPRKEEEVDRRANQQGNDFINFLIKDFPAYASRDGENWVRFLPPTWEDARHYGLDVYVHYGIGPDNGSVLCNNKMNNTKCPICEARVKAERAGNEELAKELRITKRVLVWLLDMKDEEKGPQLWAMPWTVDRDVSKISRDRRSGELYVIDRPNDGYDVTFEKSGKGITTKYSGFQIARRPSSVDEDHLDYVDENPLPIVLLERSYAEVKELFEGGTDPDEDDEKPAKRPRDREEERPTRTRDRDEDRPTRTARRSEPEEEERPARRRRDEDDEPPARRTREPEDDPPARSRRVRDEEEERPARRARDDDEDRPRKRRDEDDEPAPRRATRARDDEDDEPPPRKRSKTEEDLEDEIPFDAETGEVKDTPRSSRPKINKGEPEQSVRSAAEERAAKLKERYKDKGR